jgi:gamma-glutamyltranspeptidase/glutathione hydrolase
MAFAECRLGMTVGPHPLTADAGLEILRAGGNAFDAAVAAAFTEAVVEPAHNGVAGYGGAMVGFHAGRGVVCVDFNSQAPRAARAEMFPTEPGSELLYTVPQAIHKRGALSIGIPGVVAGLEEIHRSWGSLPMARLLEPAGRAAREGWECNTATHRCLNEHAAELSAFPATRGLLMPEGRVLQPGDRMENPELAATLERLGATGLRDFYAGELARRLVASIREQGGIIEERDLAEYRARHVAPTEMEYRGRRLHTPPVGCGGVTSFQMLEVLEGFDLTLLAPGTPEFFHLYAEVMKPCWRHRLETLGDPEFTGVPEAGQLDAELIAAIRAEVEMGLKHPRPGERMAPDPFKCTSHICTADAAGSVVSLTQTHGAAFGSWVSVPGTGLIFGHGMARFDPRPGLPNSIAPGKRPLHNMAPMLATLDGRPVAAYGTPGGRTIVNNQAYFSLCLFACEMGIAEALAAPRIHCEECEPINVEERAGPEALAALRERGHRAEPVERSGGPAHGILVGSIAGQYSGATDPRNEGKVAFG